MSAIATEKWVGVNNAGTLEKRTYKSGHVRWYHKGSYKWYRLEAVMAKNWIDKKYVVTEDEYQAIKDSAATMMILRFYLSQAHKAGGVKTKYEREKEQRLRNAKC